MEQQSQTSARRVDTSHAGSALIWALMFVVITSGMVISHSIFLASNRRSADVRHNREALVQNMARSGLVEAVGWFRRQSVQPVLSFAPQLDPLASPPLFDTIDPSVGLVREFEISDSLWGRYEVRSSDVVDISAQRGSPLPGASWEVGVRAFVYRRLNPDGVFDASPNRIVASTALTTEVRGIVIDLPVLAAINIRDINKLLLTGSDIAIDGSGKTGVSYDDSAAVPVVPTDASVTGTPAESGTTGLDLSSESVFGMTMGDLREYSDAVLHRDDRRTAPLVFRDSVVTAVDPINEDFGFVLGNSMLIIEGDIKLNPASISRIDGILYIDGSLISQGDLEVNGAVIVTGTVELIGKSRISYNDQVVQKVVQRLARYRLPRVVAPISEDF